MSDLSSQDPSSLTSADDSVDGESCGDERLDGTTWDRAVALCNRPSIWWTPDRLKAPASWAGHIPFAFWLIDVIRPNVLVELGAHAGNSYCAFLQACGMLETASSCYAVDAWADDLPAGYCGDDVYNELAVYHDRRYGAFSRLLRMTFDDALSHFPDGGVDLLHINGSHAYEAASHDFHAWLPRLSRRGVVLFHNANIRHGDFGVWKLWEELTRRYPSFTFQHSNGLGVLLVGEEPPEALRRLVEEGRDPGFVAVARRIFSRLGDALLERHAFDAVRADLVGAAASLQQAEQQLLLREAEIACLHKEIDGQQAELSRSGHEITLCKAEIARLNGETVEREGELARLAHEIALCEAEIARLHGVVDERQGELARLSQEFSLREAEIIRLNQLRNDENACISQEKEQLRGEVMLRDAWIGELRGELASFQASLSWRITAPLRRLAVVLGPRRTRFLRRALKATYWLATFQLSAKLRERRLARTPAFLNEPDQGEQFVAAAAALAPSPPPGEPDHAVAPSAFPVYEHPRVSLILRCGADTRQTRRCLACLSNQLNGTTVEVLAIPASGDVDEELRQWSGIIVTAGDETDPLSSLNAAAAQARGEYIMLLDDSLSPAPGWLPAMLDTFTRFPDAGVVSGMQTQGDRVASAGGVIFSDGRLGPSRQGMETDHYAVCSVREVDYAPIEAMMIRADLWRELGGLDPDFAPLFHADADFAMRARSKGHKVFHQPFARFTVASPVQVAGEWIAAYNTWKFRQRWGTALQSDTADPALSYQAMVRRPRALFIDDYTPTPDRDSGSGDIYWFMRIFQQLGYEVWFVPVQVMSGGGRYTDDLRLWGIICPCAPHIDSAASFLERRAVRFSVVLLYRVQLASYLLDFVRRAAPATRVIFDTVDLHFLREERAALLARSAEGLRQSHQLRLRELATIRNADCTILLSQMEYDLVSKLMPGANLRLIPIVRPVPGRLAPAAARRGVVFIGGFIHKPNIDAVTYLIEEIWPLVRRVVPDMELTIVGSSPTDEIRALAKASDGVTLLGYVQDLTEIFRNCRLTVAPLRYGAGIKGKVVTSLTYGVPCVATPVAVEGMGLVNGQHVLTGETPAAFAEAIIRLHHDEDLWSALSDGGLVFAQENFSIDSIRGRIDEMLRALSLPVG